MEIRNLSYNFIGTIDCEINHPTHGWIPFTASPEDVEQHCREIYNAAINGECGEIVAYSPPVVDEQAVLASWRDRTEVSRFQAHAALYQAGYYEDIQSYMSTEADVIQKMAWETAQVFRRNSPTVTALLPLMGITDSQLDDLFKFAMTIQA